MTAALLERTAQVVDINCSKPGWANGATVYFACNWRTYQQLRRLNYLLLENVRAHANHQRWSSKIAANRCDLCPAPLYHDYPARLTLQVRDAERTNRPDGRKGSTYLVIPAYEVARTPYYSMESVPTLNTGDLNLDEVLKQVEEWYAINKPHRVGRRKNKTTKEQYLATKGG